MFSTIQRSAAALIVAVAVLLVAHWFDAGVLFDAQVRAGRSYDTGSLVDTAVIAHFLTAAGVIAVAWVGWWARTRFVGVGYLVLGGFLAMLPAATWAFAMSINGAPAVLPDPVRRQLVDWWSSLAVGVTGAVFTISSAMLLVGLAILVRSLGVGRAGGAPLPQVPAAQS